VLERFLSKKIEAWAFILCIMLTILIMWSFSAIVKVAAGGTTIFGRYGDYAVKIADLPVEAGKLIISRGRQKNRFSRIPEGIEINKFSEQSNLPAEYGISTYLKDGDAITSLVIRDPLDGEIKRSWNVASEVKAISDFDGTLIVAGERRLQDSTESISKVDAEGRVLWRTVLPAHHALYVDSDGYIYTPIINTGFSGFPADLLRSPQKYRDDAYAILDQNGNIVSKKSVTEILVENGLAHLITGVGSIEWDAIHLNSIKPAPFTTAYYQKGDLLLSSRHLSLVFIYRPSSGKIVWYQMGPWTNQHDADFLRHGNISVFGNDVVSGHANRVAEKDVPLTYGHNNIYVYDFETGRTEKVYEEFMKGVGISTITGGSHKIFPNGDLMVHFSNAGILSFYRKGSRRVYHYGFVLNGQLDRISGLELRT
jgi:hypothetical protein